MAVVVFVILIVAVVFHRGGLQNWVVFFPRDGGSGGLSNLFFKNLVYKNMKLDLGIFKKKLRTCVSFGFGKIS